MSDATALATRDEAPAPAPSESAAIIQVIERAALNPDIDVEKVERLLAMHERAMARQAKQAYSEAMNDAQEEMGPVSQDASNPQTRSKYASYVALDKALRPIYSRHGFSLSFDTADGAPEGYVRVVCEVSHRTGHSTRPHLDMPADGKGAKGGDVMTKTHATMAAVSYAKRGLLKMIFNIAEGEADDDGNYGGGTITDEQMMELEDLLETTGADRIKFYQYMGVTTLASLPAKKFSTAKSALLKKAKQS